MKTMTNVDIYAISHELNEFLEGARVDKSFQPNKETVVMRFHKAGFGRIDLVMEAGKRIHKSQYPLPNPTKPPSFPMLLRKRLKGANLLSIKQYNFDRIVEITLKKDRIYTIVVELFSKGNIILIDEDKNIIMPLKRKSWSNRDISAKREYTYPPENGINPIKISEEELKQLFENSDDDVIRTLAKSGLGSLYAEEIILRTNDFRTNEDLSLIDKNSEASTLNEEEVKSIHLAIRSIFKPLANGEIKPEIVSGDKDDVLPLELLKYKNFKHNYFDSFNEACDEFYSKAVKNTITDEQEKAWNKKISKFEKRLEFQEETLKGFKDTIEKSHKKGELIYSNYQKIESLINVIENAKSNDYSYQEIDKILKKAKKEGMDEAEIIKSVDKMGNLIINIENTDININSKISIPENANIYYEKAKKAKRKIAGANIAIENTKKQLEDILNKKVNAMSSIMLPQKRVKKELKWYEKLRWFVSSTGILVIGGRDANSNENIVKKYLDNNDVYMHADIHGAPSIAIKLKGKELDDNTIKESAIFAASFSSAWSDGYSTQDVYWVTPEQVSKSPESGEYVAKGSFIIRGRRNHVRGVKLRIAVGIVDYEGKRLMAGPEEAMKSLTDNYIVIKPGYTKKEAMAKRILSKINEDELIELDDIVRVLPTGKCDFDDKKY
ncbi:ribosome rescue protein RqcH [uncultured Methanobrevibacter sp.]|uniref:ribosome rescue protein RqcH n=1 Tax=uncultured Methanobrevibacter sp. TaxID=253161 RepID=UPI0025DE5F3B|nr:ribosome rescue protein RqcH [uncultured Methanobrevibacter sp.]